MIDECIYKDYYIEHILLDYPCNVDNVNIYPVKILDWNNFRKYIGLFIQSKEHYNLNNDDELLRFIITNNSIDKNTEKPNDILLSSILFMICDAFNIITRSNDFEYIIDGDVFKFISKSNKYIVTNNNFEEIRKVVLKQNLQFEPIIYESEFKRKWAEKVKHGRMKKNEGLSISEIINFVRCGLCISYKEISEMNIFQLYSDFRRINNNKEFDTISLLKTTYGIERDKLPNISYTEKIFNELMKNPELDYFKDLEDNGVGEVMANK